MAGQNDEERENVNNLLGFLEEELLLTEAGMKRSLREQREQLQQLTRENARLREEIVRLREGVAKEPARRAGADPWDVPESSRAGSPRELLEDVVAAVPARRATARFACRKCGELREENDLRRVDGALYCEGCVDPDDDPVSGGSYR